MERSGRRLLTTILIALAIAGTVRWWRARPLSGTTVRHLTVGGTTRTYLLHAGGQARPGRSLILVLHGMGGSAARMERRTGGTFDALADREGAVIVYPEALGNPSRWNDGWGRGALPDDVGFLSTLVDALAAELDVDRKRVFAAGLSNGAAMVHRLACERPLLVAAVGPVAGGMPPDVARACAQGAPVAVIAMHGTADSMVPFDQSIRDGVSAWARRDGCPTQPASSPLPDLDPGDGTRTRADVFEPCAAGTAVAFYTIEGGGHAWPGGERVWGRGNVPRDFDAGAVIWDFFLKHPRR